MDERESALKRYKDQVKRAIEKGNKAEELSAQDSLGQVFISLEQFNEAIQCHTKLANIAIELGLSIPEGRAYYKIAHANSSLGNHKKAIEYYQKCLHVLQGKGDSAIERMAYCNLGMTYFVSGRTQEEYRESIKYLETSLSMASEAKDIYVEARACHNLGNSYSALGRYEEAISYYERSLQHNDGRAGIAYRLIGDAYFKLKNYQEAIKNHRDALECAVKFVDKEAQKTAYLNLGVDSHTMRDYGNAVFYFHKYLTMAKMLGDRKGEVEAHRFMGNAYFELQKNEEALGSHQSSLSTAIEIGDKYGEECAYANMGIAYHKLGKYQEAIECYEKKLNIAVQKGDRKEEGRASRNIATAHAALRNYDQAIVHQKKALQISKELGDVSGEAAAYSNIAQILSLSANYTEALKYYEKYLHAVDGDKESERKAYRNMGGLYGKLSRHKESIECLEKELLIVLDKGNALAEASVYCNLGNDYVAIGRYEDAFDVYKKCLAIALEYEDKHLQAKVYCNIGNAYFVLGNQPEAEKHHQRSAYIAISSGDGEAEARGYSILSRISSNSGDYKKAIEYAKRVLDVVQLVRDNDAHQVSAYHDIGKNYFLLGNYYDAISYLEKSANLAHEIGNKKAEGEAYEYLGYVYEEYFRNFTTAVNYYTAHLNLATDIGDKGAAGKACRNVGTAFLFQFLREKANEHKDKAENFLIESLKWYDSLFQDIGEQDQHKINVVDSFIYTHKLLVEFYIETEQPQRALLVSEQERGRALEDLLFGKYKINKNVDTVYDFLGYADIANKVLSQDSCILFYSDLMKMGRSNFELQVGTWVLDLDNRVSFYRNELKEIKALLKEKSLEEDIQYSDDVLHDIVGITYTTMSARAAGSKAENRSFSHHLIGSLDNDESTLQEHETTKRNIYDEDLDDDYFEVLFDALITPVKDKLTHEEIIIIPDGPLFKVPFAALRDRKTNTYLSETKRIRIVPSLTTLKILKECSQESHSMKGALIVGDPDVEGKRILKGNERFFTPLPNARIEAEEIAWILGVNALTGAQASKQVIKQRLREGVAVIHFAAHGCADSGEIVLSPPESLKATQTIPSEEDYLLTMNEVQEIGLRARLVVLSCCHSGRGDIKSEGVIGMSRAFLAAGALAVVATLWAVDDLGTRVFMRKFYAHLKQGKSASRSLQQAMKELREMVQYEHPSFWAPFVLIGDDVTVSL